MTERLRLIPPAIAAALLFALAACDDQGGGTQTGEVPAQQEQPAPSQ